MVCVLLFVESVCKPLCKQFLTKRKYTERCELVIFPTHLSMTPLGARGSSHSSCTERVVRVTGRGGGWWSGGAARVCSSLRGPWLQHCQVIKTGIQHPQLHIVCFVFLFKSCLDTLLLNSKILYIFSVYLSVCQVYCAILQLVDQISSRLNLQMLCRNPNTFICPTEGKASKEPKIA